MVTGLRCDQLCYLLLLAAGTRASLFLIAFVSLVRQLSSFRLSEVDPDHSAAMIPGSIVLAYQKSDRTQDTMLSGALLNRSIHSTSFQTRVTVLE